jgi:hypothetical protein
MAPLSWGSRAVLRALDTAPLAVERGGRPDAGRHLIEIFDCGAHAAFGCLEDKR